MVVTLGSVGWAESLGVGFSTLICVHMLDWFDLVTSRRCVFLLRSNETPNWLSNNFER